MLQSATAGDDDSSTRPLFDRARLISGGKAKVRNIDLRWSRSRPARCRRGDAQLTQRRNGRTDVGWFWRVVWSSMIDAVINTANWCSDDRDTRPCHSLNQSYL